MRKLFIGLTLIAMTTSAQAMPDCVPRYTQHGSAWFVSLALMPGMLVLNAMSAVGDAPTTYSRTTSLRCSTLAMAKHAATGKPAQPKSVRE
jgi:hypothetical protein